MVSKVVRALALRVVYHVQQKLPDLHGQPTRTLVMMTSAFIAAGGPWLSQMGRQLVDLPGSLQEKVKRMSRFLCQSRFEVREAFLEYAVRIVETIAHAHPQRMIAVAWDWTDLGDYQGLWLSIPYHGRALPLGCWVLEKAFAVGSMTPVEEEMIRAFIDALPESLRRRIVILADRGFAKSDLMRELSERKVHWVIRQPRNHKVCLEGSWKALSEIPLGPGADLFLHDIRCIQNSPVQVQLACRRLPTGKANDPDDDTWYLATNVYDLKQALSWYSLRFQIEEMFRDLKSRLHMDKHLLGTEESVAKMMLIVALAYLVVLEDGTQWRGRIALNRIQKTTARGTLSVYSIAKACFDAALPEVPAEVGDLIVARWTNLRAA
jgi:hypothetical protein